MSIAEPEGFRLSRYRDLTQLAAVIGAEGRSLRRDEATRALARVVAELLVSSDDADTVFSRLSRGQVGLDDLVVAAARDGSLLHYAADFIDTAHAAQHRTDALPLPGWLDLRFEVRFLSDPAADRVSALTAAPQPDGVERSDWVYALVGSESHLMPQIWAQLEDVESYPLVYRDQLPARPESEDLERCAAWERVLSAARRSGALSWTAPPPALLLECTESLRREGRDRALAADGSVTVSAVLLEVERILGDRSPHDLEEQVTWSLNPAGKHAHLD